MTSQLSYLITANIGVSVSNNHRGIRIMPHVISPKLVTRTIFAFSVQSPCFQRHVAHEQMHVFSPHPATLYGSVVNIEISIPLIILNTDICSPKVLNWVSVKIVPTLNFMRALICFVPYVGQLYIWNFHQGPKLNVQNSYSISHAAWKQTRELPEIVSMVTHPEVLIWVAQSAAVSLYILSMNWK